MGIGVDIVNIGRLSTAMQRSEGLGRMVFTLGERNCTGRHANREKHLAACFAAKEAFLKAVGLGLWQGVPLKEIEVIHTPSGKPCLSLGPLARKAVERVGGRSMFLSLSHQSSIAIAFVLVQ